MSQQYYIKATLDGGVSGHDSNFIYRLGHNTHPNPDRKSKEACGEGIHLAKTINAAKRYVPKATEFYVTKPGEILGEDRDKIRVADCDLLFQVPKSQLKGINYLLGGNAPQTTNPLCGCDWLASNMFKLTWADFYAQRMVVSVDGKQRVVLNPLRKRKDVKEILEAVVA